MTKVMLFGIAMMVLIAPLVIPVYAEIIRIPTGSSSPDCKKTDECFIPYSTEISKGSNVTWINDDSVAHTITSGSARDGPDGTFDSRQIKPGETFSHVFKMTGTFGYFCTVYPWMSGVITVNDSIDSENKDTVENAVTGISNIENKTGVMPTKFVMSIDDQEIVLNYGITGGSILDIYPESDSLVVKINATEQGVLSINLPREIIDAKTGDMDDYFYVLVDEEEVDFDEIATPTDRTISVWFSEDTDEIEIIGTFVIPEFGMVALFVLLAGVIPMIAISRSKLSVIS
ncbi:MAG: PEFG-CTERM sorting domain-containing protein [Nitrosopumilus sp.]|nr:PEFG-CTERM sorting domain-containing protein [Nitrosopumilus sp.]